jgi:predicted Ser/Thr protein kinase
MCPNDPTDSIGATRGDDPCVARLQHPAVAVTGLAVSGPARATVPSPDPSPEYSGSLGLLHTGTVGHAMSGSTQSLLAPLISGEPPPAAETQNVPGYELLAPLGEGGMGVVWLARQAKLNRLVALKMVQGEHRAGSKELFRFLAEAEAVAAVKHAHIVQVYEYGEANGRPFLAMEYLSGGTLSDLLKRTGRLEPKAAGELMGTLAGAVQAAHDLGIVHRDLKPSNVIYDELGHAKVTDFGLAKRAGGSDLTATLAVMGTPAYMAPEQARGGTKFVGPLADIHSLGVMLYECLTGTRPFDAEDQLALLRKVEDEAPDRPSKRTPGLPRDLELICLKCLAKDPLERYATASALAADLARFVAGEPVSVRAAGVVERAAKWARRKPTLAAAYTLGLLAVLLGGLGGFAIWQWRTAERARDRANAARSEAMRARAESDQQRRKLERLDYGRTMQVAHQEWREARIADTVASLDSTRDELRGWEWRYVHRLCHSDMFTLRGHTESVVQPRWVGGRDRKR